MKNRPIPRSRATAVVGLVRAHAPKVCGAVTLGAALFFSPARAIPASQGVGGIAADNKASAAPATTLEETRITMGKWIEAQQIISREANDWQQGKEILVARVALVQKEIAALEEKIAQAQTRLADGDQKRSVLDVENDQLKAVGLQLGTAVGGMEAEVRRLFWSLPEPVKTKLQPLHQRIPEDPATTRISAAERFQNVLGILNEINKANNELTVNYEVRNLADGRSVEVRSLYVGLAQAYYVSSSGEAGIGRPGPEGWQWDPSKSVAGETLRALEIIEGKQTPAFVPLPVKLQ